MINFSINKFNIPIFNKQNARAKAASQPALGFYPNLRPLPCDTVQFTGKKEKPEYDEFLRLFRNKYRGKRVTQTLYKISKNQNNCIGEGSDKRVYSIPNIDGYLLGINKDKRLTFAEIYPVEDDLPKYNFGQPIASNGAEMMLMKRVEGETYGLEDWLNEKYDRIIERRGFASLADAYALLRIMKKVEKLPLEAYVHFAKEIEYLNQNNIKTDCINPNNLIIDYENNKINMIDLLPTQEQYNVLPQPLNTILDMQTLLIDGMLLPKCYDALDGSDEDQEELISTAKSIMEKCKKAGEIAGLKDGSENILLTLKLISGDNDDMLFIKTYKEFLEFYKEKLA